MDLRQNEPHPNDKRFPEIPLYPTPPSTYKVIEPYLDFAADIEADKVRAEVMHVEAMRSHTSPQKSRKKSGNANLPNSRPSSYRSPRQIRTAPSGPSQSLTVGSDVRESLQLLKRPQKVS
jgi:hypothetical protein